MSEDALSTAGEHGPREVEAALIVRSDDPEAVVERIAALDQIGRYRLLAQRARRIRDRYFNTPNSDLRSKRLALRIREQDGESLITFKADRRREGSSVDRIELEAPWAPEALDAALAELAEAGVRLEVCPQAASDPATTLRGLGLEEVQVRKTRRIVRHVAPPEDESRVLAELAIDRVAYRLNGRTVRIHEVEIEAKADGVDLEPIVRALRERVPELEEWAYGKLPTGMAIEQALAEGTLKLGPGGVVVPASLHELARLLRE